MRSVLWFGTLGTEPFALRKRLKPYALSVIDERAAVTAEELPAKAANITDIVVFLFMAIITEPRPFRKYVQVGTFEVERFWTSLTAK